MKRKIEYIAEDGKVFSTRAEAAAHEVDSARRKRMTDFFEKRLKLSDTAAATVAVTTVVETIIANASEFSEVLSARATRRQLRQTQTPLRRPRYRGKTPVSAKVAANG